ncbi:MAG: rhodanese-like domain-containing protein [Deltaproteobacteria bacterium]|nr:rhodanese-like domain-containing protein [Deltaproteobacteria bacterium]
MLRRLMNLPFTVASKAARAFSDREDQRIKEKYGTAHDPGTVPINREADVDPAVAAAGGDFGNITMNVATVLHEREEQPVAFVDVRDAAAWARGHIPGAIHMPMHEVGVRVSELPWEQLVVTYCDDGDVSRQAVIFFRERGMEDTFVLEGGLAAWKKAGLEVKS